MRSSMIPAALAIGIAAVAAAPAAALMPAGTAVATAATSGVTPAQYSYRRHHRFYRSYGPYAQQGWVPYWKRGFEDPGFAYHGNINGCAEDLGYGRWEPCNKGR
jgi:hypothetical protein